MAPGQAGLVSANLPTLAEAPFEPGAPVQGLRRGRTPAGLLAMVDPRAQPPRPVDDPRAACLRRLMVDARVQGAGVGAAAVRAALSIARDRCLPRLSAHVADEARSAPGLHQRLRFRLAARRMGGPGEAEVEIVVDLQPPARPTPGARRSGAARPGAAAASRCFSLRPGRLASNVARRGMKRPTSAPLHLAVVGARQNDRRGSAPNACAQSSAASERARYSFALIAKGTTGRGPASQAPAPASPPASRDAGCRRAR